MKIYIAGPMRGKYNYNFENFDRATALWRGWGHEVISPADQDRELGNVIEHDCCECGYTVDMNPEKPMSLEDFMRIDLPLVASVDAVVLLEGWERSEGSKHEVRTAIACGVALIPDTTEGPYQAALSGAEAERRIALADRTPKGVKLVGLSGYGRAGKDTAAQALVERGWSQAAFADPMREMAEKIDPIVSASSAVFQRYKTAVKTWGYDTAKVKFPEIRRFLQTLGTDAMRDLYGEDVWVDLALNKLQEDDRVVFTDVRFPNEAQAIKDAGGIVIRVERWDGEHHVGPANDHPSETSLDDWAFDGWVTNDGSIEDLQEELRSLVRSLGIPVPTEVDLAMQGMLDTALKNYQKSLERELIWGNRLGPPFHDGLDETVVNIPISHEEIDGVTYPYIAKVVGEVPLVSTPRDGKLTPYDREREAIQAEEHERAERNKRAWENSPHRVESANEQPWPPAPPNDFHWDVV